MFKLFSGDLEGEKRALVLSAGEFKESFPIGEANRFPE